MESVAFPRRPGQAPSACALTAERARPLADGLIKSPKPLMKKQAVKRHHHKHNLRHRYEFLETLGKGTYGKVKKARESSGRLVSVPLCSARGSPGAHRASLASRVLGRPSCQARALEVSVRGFQGQSVARGPESLSSTRCLSFEKMGLNLNFHWNKLLRSRMEGGS